MGLSYFNAYIYYNNTQYFFELKGNSYSYAYFDSVNDFIYIPKALFDYLIEVYLKDSIEKGKCTVREYETRQILCLNILNLQQGEIVLNIGQYYYALILNESNDYWN